MAVAQEAVLYIAGAVLCFGAVGFVLHWAGPVNGEMSPKLRGAGMEIFLLAALRHCWGQLALDS